MHNGPKEVETRWLLSEWRRYREFCLPEQVDDHFARALEQQSYFLVVVGESSSGKSALLNGLMRTALLPTGVLAGPKTVVEIFHAVKPSVTAHFADGRVERLTVNEGGESVLGRKLRELAAAGNSAPVLLRCGYPLPVPALTLVDTPGVNVDGETASLAASYLAKAHAVLVVQPLDRPVEQASLQKFVTEAVPATTRPSLFLLLTKAGLLSGREKRTKIEQTQALWAHLLPPERVLAVDPLLRELADELAECGGVAELEQRYSQGVATLRGQDAIVAEQKELLLERVRPTGKGVDETRDLLLQLSGFAALEQQLQGLAQRAPQWQASQLLQCIQTGYDELRQRWGEEAELLSLQREDPQSFLRQLEQRQRQLRHARQHAESLRQELEDEFISNSLRELQRRYSGRVEQCVGESAVYRLLVELNDELRQLGQSLYDRLQQGWDQHWADRGGSWQPRRSVNTPQFSSRQVLGQVLGQVRPDDYRQRRQVGAEGLQDARSDGGFDLAKLISQLTTEVLPSLLLRVPVGGKVGKLLQMVGGVLSNQPVAEPVADTPPPAPIEVETFDRQRYLGDLRSRLRQLLAGLSTGETAARYREFARQCLDEFSCRVARAVADRDQELQQLQQQYQDQCCLQERIDQLRGKAAEAGRRRDALEAAAESWACDGARGNERKTDGG